MHKKIIFGLSILITLLLSSCFYIPNSTSSSSQDVFYIFKGSGKQLLKDLLIDSNKMGVGLSGSNNPHVLVVPVQFKEKQIYGKTYGSFNENDLVKLEKIFIGTEEETGWESVNSYYKKSSYGKLDIQFDFTSVYTTNNDFKYYQNIMNLEGDRVILEEVLDYFDDSIDFSQYDADNDSTIDGIYLVYSLPYSGSDRITDKNLAKNMDEDFWWAWTNWYNEDEVYDGKKPDYYMWISIDFINDGYDEKDLKKINVNAETFIHETGHMLGLDDYYDYVYEDESNKKDMFIGGVGGADMMDSSVGDHSPISKVLLGWIAPTVITESMENIKLISMQEEATNDTHQILLIPKKWEDSYFSEYYLVDLYTPTGLNKLHNGEYGLFTKTGVRIYHIDATVDQRVGKMYDDDYYSLFSYNNSTTDHLFVKLMEGDNNNSLMRLSALGTPAYATNGDLFYENYEFGNNQKWYNGDDIEFNLLITHLEDEYALINIEVK